MQQVNKSNLTDERIKGTPIELALYADSMKQLAQNNMVLSDFFKKNSEFTSNIVQTIMDIVDRPTNLKVSSNQKKQDTNLNELEHQLISCAESLQDQSEIFNYCVNTNQKEENHD